MTLEVSASSLSFSCPEFHIFLKILLKWTEENILIKSFYDISVMEKINPEL